MDFILDWLEWFTDFFTGDGEGPGLFEYILDWLKIWFLKLQTAAVSLFWSIAEVVLDQLNLSSALSSAWGSIDGELMGYMSFFRIPEAFSIILSAKVTRFVLNMVGW